MKNSKKQIKICTGIGVVLAWVSGGILATIIPVAIGALAMAGDYLYQKELKK